MAGTTNRSSSKHRERSDGVNSMEAEMVVVAVLRFPCWQVWRVPLLRENQRANARLLRLRRGSVLGELPSIFDARRTLQHL